jgi:hypothetical protein
MTLENCVEAITMAIIRQEGGTNPKSVHVAMVDRFGLHNPGHLIWARQRGAVPVRLTPKGRMWAGWKSYDDGVEGVRRQVRLDISRGLTLRQLISKYAPAAENDTAAYIRDVGGWADMQTEVPIQAQLQQGSNGEPTRVPHRRI